jgi:hypothetical protein
MNRTIFLKQTLPKNIEDNLSYGNLEFVVLNYNSTDGMHEWIMGEMADYIDLGILKYIRTLEPQYFLWSHSKNVVAKQAKNDIICNVDADNFMGKGFAEYINAQFHRENDIYLAVNKQRAMKDCYGRICLARTDFNELRGYDESMDMYGFEDFDLTNRLEILGRKRKFIDKKEFLNAITHDDDERLINQNQRNKVKKIYLRHETPSISELLYVLNSNEVRQCKVVENRTYGSKSIENLFLDRDTFEYKYRILDNSWVLGSYTDSGDIFFKNSKALNLASDSNYLEIQDPELYSSLVMFHSEIKNRTKMKTNMELKQPIVNNTSFGECEIEIFN